MKAIKDKLVSSDLYYFVLSYLDATKYAPVISRELVKYDEKTGFPIFQMSWLDYATFVELIDSGLQFMLEQSQELTLENIDKYNIK